MSKPSNNRKPRRRGNSQGRKPKDSVTTKKDAEVEFSSSTGNPFEFYNANPVLTENAARINTNNPLGSSYSLFTDYVTEGTEENQIPKQFMHLFESGVGTLEFIPGPGPSLGPTSPVNIAASNIYSFIRHANSGARNYDVASLAMYILAMDAGYMWLELLTRLYGTLNLYSAENKYYPRILVTAQGFDFDDCRKNIPNLQWTINRLAKILSNLYMPHITIFDRHKWCCGNYFMDQESRKGQTYLIKPAGLHLLKETTGPDPDDKPIAYLEFVPWNRLVSGSNVGPVNASLLTYDNIATISRHFEEIIMFSDDMAIISGDIAKAYGDNVMQCDMVPNVFELMPKYDPMVLHMIHNATLWGSGPLTNPSNQNVTQVFDDANVYWYLFYQGLPTALAGTVTRKGLIRGNRLIDFKSDDPSNELIVEGTRFTSMFGPGAEQTYGTEICTFFHIYYYSYADASSVQPVYEKRDIESIMNFSLVNVDALGRLAEWNMAPGVVMYNVQGTDSSSVPTMIATFMDTDNYTVIDYDALFKLNETAILSEWDVPQINNFK